MAGYATRSDAAGAPAATGASQQAASETGAGQDDASLSPAERARAMVLAGRKGPMPQLMRDILADHDVMFAINDVLIPALD